MKIKNVSGLFCFAFFRAFSETITIVISTPKTSKMNSSSKSKWSENY